MRSEDKLVIVVAGSTGVGKTRLGIELCEKLGGEIISADSMQIYKELNIVTNKVTEKEKMDCVHYMIDVADIFDNFTVTTFRDMALPILNDILDRHKIPLIVGGTNYYIESLLYKNLIDCNGLFENTNSSMSGKDLWNNLNKIDPAHAAKFHQNDHRRILRSLEIINGSGRLCSDIIARQSAADDTAGLPSLRYSNNLFIWLYCEDSHLSDIIAKRCSMMIQNGLWEEIWQLYQKCKVHYKEISYSKGIFQSIGFKEFLKCMIEADHKSISFDEISAKTKEDCLRDFVQATIRYGKKQNRWIKNRICADPRIRVLKIAVSKDEDWEANVFRKAYETIRIIQADPEDLKLSRLLLSSVDKNPIHSFICETCNNKRLIGLNSWSAHLKSKGHKFYLKRKIINCSLVE